MPNGIAFLKERQQVAVVDSLDRSVLVYSRDSATGDLALARRLPVNTACDNLVVLTSGKLMSACHPKQLTFALHAAFHIESPTQVCLCACVLRFPCMASFLCLHTGTHIHTFSLSLSLSYAHTHTHTHTPV